MTRRTRCKYYGAKIRLKMKQTKVCILSNCESSHFIDELSQDIKRMRFFSHNFKRGALSSLVMANWQTLVNKRKNASIWWNCLNQTFAPKIISTKLWTQRRPLVLEGKQEATPWMRGFWVEISESFPPLSRELNHFYSCVEFMRRPMPLKSAIVLPLPNQLVLGITKMRWD